MTNVLIALVRVQADAGQHGADAAGCRPARCPSFFSMKSAQKRRPNMISEVKTNRILPCSEVRMLPVMFWIQPSVPSSTAPTRAWAMNSTNSRNEPIEKLVMTADDDQQRAADAVADVLADRASVCRRRSRGVSGAKMPAKNSASRKQTTSAAEDADVLEHLAEARGPSSTLRTSGICWPRNITP